MANPLVIDCTGLASGTGAIGLRAVIDTDALFCAFNETTGLAAVSSTINVYGCEFSASSGTLNPPAGDRAVFDAAAYQARHANDIDAGIHWTAAQLAATYLSKVLTSAHILVGNGSNVATDRALSGDATIDNTGALTIGAKKVGASKIALTDDKLLIGGGDGAAHEQSVNGDATLSNAGALTLATVNANTGTFGDATHVAQVTLNAKGLATAAVNVAIIAGHDIQDEGAALPARRNLNFVGNGVDATDDGTNNATLVTVPIWAPLSNGDPDNPNLIFDAQGGVILVQV
jgi:hypothetical protein